MVVLLCAGARAAAPSAQVVHVKVTRETDEVDGGGQKTE